MAPSVSSSISRADCRRLRDPAAFQALRQMAFQRRLVLPRHPSRRVSWQVRKLDGKPCETRSFPVLGRRPNREIGEQRLDEVFRSLLRTVDHLDEGGHREVVLCLEHRRQ